MIDSRMSPLEWVRRWLGPDAVIRAELSDLTFQVDQLAFDRDDLTERVARAEQARTDLRRVNRELRDAVRAAYETVEVGTCTKVRYLRREDAHQHARLLAEKQLGEPFHTYRCPRCPSYFVSATRPWHVAHCNDNCRDRVWVEGVMFHHGCGCVRHSRTAAVLFRCDLHAEGVSA